MKKLLLYAAAIAALASCSEAQVEDVTLGVANKRDVTISVEGEQSRVAINDDWSMSWQTGDELLAYSLGTIEKFTATVVDETPSQATLVGSQSFTTNYNLVYPYSGASTLVDGNFAVDLTAQSEGATATYMISSERVDKDEEAPYVVMRHLGAAVALDMQVADYDGYTLQSVVVSGLNSECEVSVARTFDEESSYANAVKSPITITDGESVITSGESIFVRFNILPTTLLVGDEVRVSLSIAKESGVTKVISKTIPVTEETPFARASYNTIICDFSSTDAVSDDWMLHRAESYSDISLGTESDPIEISTAAELARLTHILACSGTTQAGLHYKLVADIDLSGYYWNPIGYGKATGSVPFTGTFDGDGHTISGMYIDSDDFNQGLFGVVDDGAVVKNVVVRGYVHSSEDFAAGVVAYCKGLATISNCHNYASVKGYWSAGGVVGDIENAGACVVIDCYNYGEVKASGYSGGVVGSVSNRQNQDPATIQGCVNEGVVSGSADAVGGVVGYSYNAIIKQSHNTASISGTHTAGGVVGINKGLSSVIDSYNSGKIYADAESDDTITFYGVGGVVGENDEDLNIINCYNLGDVSGDGGKINIGGVVGYFNKGYVYITYNVGSVTRVSGSGKFGGVCGFISETATLKSSYMLASCCVDGNTEGYVITKNRLQDEFYVNDANSTVEDYNELVTDALKAHAWVYNEGEYPTIDYTLLP